MTLTRPLPEALRAPITDLASAKRWIEALQAADLAFHFEDDPFDCLSRTGLSKASLAIIAARVRDLYDLEWGPRRGLGYWYCPIGYLLRVEKLRGDPDAPAVDQAVGYEPGAEVWERVGDLVMIDRDCCPAYDYGAPGRYEVHEGGACVGAYDTPLDAFAAHPLLGLKHGALVAAAGHPSAWARP